MSVFLVINSSKRRQWKGWKAQRVLSALNWEKIRLRYTPEINFIFDNSLEEGAKVLSLLNEIQKEGGKTGFEFTFFLGPSYLHVEKYNRFTLGCHLNPDGDAIGSLLALGLSLEKAGKQVEMILPEGIPLTFQFLPGIQQTVEQPTFHPEVVISVDCAERGRLQLPDEIFASEPLLVNIDHHISNDHFGQVNLVLPEASATGQIIFALLEKCAYPIDSAIASALYTAIATDTGFFRYSNTTGEVLSIAARLVEDYQISPSQIAERVYEERSFASIRLLGEVLSTLQISGNQRYSWMYLSQEMIEKYEVEMEEIENYVNYTNSIRGRGWLVF